MNPKTKIYFFLKYSIVISIIFLFFSCSKKNDDIKEPVIKIISPIDNQSFKLEEKIYFNSLFSDDIELKSYTIIINNVSPSCNTKTPWTFSQTWKFEKNITYEQVAHNEILVPSYIDDVDLKNNVLEGKYNFIVTCIDKADNESKIVVPIFVSKADTNFVKP